ncbi:MAG: hypothetical protein ACI3Y5_08520 [Prevotella sp.]
MKTRCGAALAPNAAEAQPALGIVIATFRVIPVALSAIDSRGTSLSV